MPEKAIKQLIAIHPDGTVDVTPLTALPKLEVIQKIVGGYIELVPYFNFYNKLPCVAFCNEYGKIKHLRRNVHADVAWQAAIEDPKMAAKIGKVDFLVGDIAIVVGPREWLRRM